jgi:hypothetical protein
VHHSLKPKKFAEGKLERAIALNDFLNKHQVIMTYGEFGKVVGHPAVAVGDILGEINRLHKEGGGTGMNTQYVLNKKGSLGGGFFKAKESLGL